MKSQESYLRQCDSLTSRLLTKHRSSAHTHRNNRALSRRKTQHTTNILEMTVIKYTNFIRRFQFDRAIANLTL